MIDDAIRRFDQALKTLTGSRVAERENPAAQIADEPMDDAERTHAAGLIGDKVSLGFVEATEDQVCEHLERHLDALPAQDAKSRAIVERMHEEEARHGSEALEMGGTEFPAPVKQAMTLASRVMTETTYRI